MLAYLVRRLILAVLTTAAISVLSFVIIKLPPGDYVTSYIAQMSGSGGFVSEQEAEAVRRGAGVEAPRGRGDRRSVVADDGGGPGGRRPHLGARAADRDLLGRAAVLGG